MTLAATGLALLGALAYGICDFVGGIASRRSSPWPVALLTNVGVLGVVAASASVTSGNPRAADFVWGALAGIGSGAGAALFFRALARGAMTVVAPLAAVGSGVVPVIAGAATGDRPAALAWLGIALALPGIWLVSGGTTRPNLHAPGVSDGLVAGSVWGLMFVAYGRVGHGAGFWPIASSQPVAILTVITLATAFGGSVLPRTRASWGGIIAGLLAGMAQVSFILSTRHGLLSLSAVLVSLYPAATVFLAITFLRERLHRTQVLGLALSAVSVGLIALA